jgi:outer membrane protein
MPSKVTTVFRAAALPALLLLAAPAAAQQPLKIAVFDIGKVMEQSTRAKAVNQSFEGPIKTLEENKLTQARAMQQEIADLEKRIREGLALDRQRIQEMSAELQAKKLALEQFGQNARLELQALQAKQKTAHIDPLEKEIFDIINAMAQEQGYSLIFHKFESGLLYASDSVDITAEVVRRFDAARAAGR